MTDPIAATPGWFDDRLETITAALPVSTRPAIDVFAECLSGMKAPAAPSDMLGAEFEPCHAALRQALLKAGIDHALLDLVMADLEALEAEVAAQS